MSELAEQFQEWLNTQGSGYVLWREVEMKAAQIGFKAGLEYAIAAQREPMGCSHPRACVMSGELEPGAHEGTSWCGWCASLDDAQREEREASQDRG